MPRHARFLKTRRITRAFAFLSLAFLTALACGVKAPARAPVTTPPANDAATVAELEGADVYAPPAIAAPFWPNAATNAIDGLVKTAIGSEQIPGCVIAIGTRKEVLFLKAYGFRSLVPQRTPMTIDTIFDLASLTKPLATALSIVWLSDHGLLDLDAAVDTIIPELRNAKTMTVRSLLLHTSGLQSDLPLADFTKSRTAIVKRVTETVTKPPNTRFLYSDSGYLLLEEIVRRTTGSTLDVFTNEHIFEPLGMKETRFLPLASLKARIAPTELRDGAIIHGDVHDPRAYLLGGVAGHAGVFSTAQDMAQFGAWLLASEGSPIISANSFRAYTAPHDVPDAVRALGWDVRSRYSSNRPKWFSPRAFGHGGYTGTSLWIDPERDLYVVFLSHRVHPTGKGSSNALASAVGDVAVRATGQGEGAMAATWGTAIPVMTSNGSMLNTSVSGEASDAGMPESAADASTPREREKEELLLGVDVLEKRHFSDLRGAHVALITNQTGRSKSGARTIDLLRAQKDLQLLALFAPEHGLDGKVDERIRDDIDDVTGLPVYSLYGERFSPSKEQLAGIDTLVFDIQDAGTRFFTYASTMRRAMEVAARENLRFVVLDRPNPLGGVRVEGPILDVTRTNFVNYFPLPVRHGMTMGELALLFDAAAHLGTRLKVIPLQGWDSKKRIDELGLPYLPPSPNLRTPIEALLYPGVGLLEAADVSVGRGTATPFEVLGAPWIDRDALVRALDSEHLEGVSFEAIEFTPTSSTHKGKACSGVKIVVTDANRFRPVRLGLAFALALRRRHPNEFSLEKLDRLLGSPALLALVDQGRSLDEMEASYRAALDAFVRRRSKYLLYPRAESP